MNNNPIGILDSGLGGLTVWKEIAALLPHESTVYIADSQNTPYGAKSHEEIYHLSKRLIEFLLTKQAKVIVIACNTITVSCLDRLRNDYPNLPIIGTVPVIKTAVEITKNKKIGVLSTTGTAESQYQKELIHKFAGGINVINLGTDELVPLIEKGELEGEKIDAILQNVLFKFKEAEVDALALGCTHFPLLRSQMEKILGSSVRVLDSGQAIARQVKRILEHNQIIAEEKEPKYEFYTTGDSEIAKNILAGKIIGQEGLEFFQIDL